MSQIPADLQYTKEHEWVAPTSTSLRIRMGITDYAQGALGDIVYVQMPKIGETVIADKVCGEVESTKSVSEIFAPVSGTVVAVNSDLVVRLHKSRKGCSAPPNMAKSPRNAPLDLSKVTL